MASTNTTWSGGSSNVFSSAFERGLREHVNLVDDVHLPAPGRGEGRPCDKVPHRFNPVVGRRVELVDVEGGAPGYIHAGVAHTTGFTVERTFAVQCLREDSRRRRLPRSQRGPEKRYA